MTSCRDDVNGRCTKCDSEASLVSFWGLSIVKRCRNPSCSYYVPDHIAIEDYERDYQ